MAKVPIELSVGQLSKRSGLPVSTLHYYEAEGLIAANRTAANHRRYPRAVLRRVAIIKAAQRLGLPLSAIRQAMATLPDGRTPNARDWEAMSQIWRDELNERIARLTVLRDDLGRCIGCGCLSVDRCPLINDGDKLGDEGAGPRTLDPL
ncbi:MerR family transcriptional regulator, redox-sensitive transcriptional activator SoxR [Monaibacterium marinum]|uniref:MerR family transcriptional regulator, redox-sensitive transcriptional activator SoxR n=1 Tax=Pontivivens marinum TaxID=1690039 RepID=A0A2C9CQB5_9RHOB|nr:redox-sensitive transcriptional activator SoxR [Monaibacterium marinum]SOH93442.1 MerR family transcriptional regulator, redox-sensitive transcriptional activator SoxR [Monaibacterium marinum]